MLKHYETNIKSSFISSPDIQKVQMWRCHWTSLCLLFADMRIGPKTDENMIRTACWFVEQDEDQKDNQDAHLSAQGGAKEGDGQAGEEEGDEDQRTLLQIHLQHFLLLLHKSLRLISDHRCHCSETSSGLLHFQRLAVGNGYLWGSICKLIDKLW